MGTKRDEDSLCIVENSLKTACQPGCHFPGVTGQDRGHSEKMTLWDTSQKIERTEFARFPGRRDSILLLKTTRKQGIPNFVTCKNQENAHDGMTRVGDPQQTSSRKVMRNSDQNNSCFP
jgi:hypothetical protein